MAAETARIWAAWQQAFEEHAHAGRVAFAPYNLNVAHERVTHGPKHAATVPVPAIGCLVGYNDSGYGDCSTSTWQVVAVERSKKNAAREAVRVVVRPICGLDIGSNAADAMPQRPGECAYDPARGTATLALKWTLLGAESYASWRERSDGHWHNASWTMGRYEPSTMGIDK